MKYIIQFLITAGVVYLIANGGGFPGVTVENFSAALIFSVILGVLNLFLGTILRIITFPIRLITLGLFGFVIWAFLIYMADQMVPGISIQGATPLIVMTIILTFLSFFLKMFR